MSDFDLPSLEGLPEGPWKAIKLSGEHGLAIADANKVVICSRLPAEVAHAIAAVPDMVRAIERLRTPWRVQLDSYRAENDRLRDLNAEFVGLLDEMLPPYGGVCGDHALLEKARAILAKAKEQP